MNTTLKDIAPSPQALDNEFERLYIALRTQEQRLYTDTQVAQLPLINKSNIHYKEWKIRKRSAESLIGHINKKKRTLRILEVGCGNGWLSAQLSNIHSAFVMGQDINQTEIEQAKRVFNKHNLKFFYEDIFSKKFDDLRFDLVIFAASIQYFSSLPDILDRTLSLLTKDGEIHILDTKFYERGEVADAKLRTVNYYAGMGYPELAKHYHHHQLTDLGGVKYKVMYDPTQIVNRLIRANPFYWISIKKS